MSEKIFKADDSGFDDAVEFVDLIQRQGGIATIPRLFEATVNGEDCRRWLVVNYVADGKLSFNDPMVVELVELFNNGTREAIIDWLAKDDRNGVYTDEDCDDERLPKMTMMDCLEQIVTILSTY